MHGPVVSFTPLPGTSSGSAPAVTAAPFPDFHALRLYRRISCCYPVLPPAVFLIIIENVCLKIKTPVFHLLLRFFDYIQRSRSGKRPVSNIPIRSQDRIEQIILAEIQLTVK